MKNLEKQVHLSHASGQGTRRLHRQRSRGSGSYGCRRVRTLQDRNRKTVAGIVAAGGKATAMQEDVSKPDRSVNVCGHKRTICRLDILVNNAGAYKFGPREEVTPEEFDRQFNLNVLGLLLCYKGSGSARRIGSAALSSISAQWFLRCRWLTVQSTPRKEQWTR
jgi:NAD(P)-dependent dehydrogenase (short-subunit alcohol dehydrogenase family)